jgi:hypothetical protein
MSVSGTVNVSNATLLLSQVSSSSYLNANLASGSQTNLQLYDCSMQEIDVAGGNALFKRTSLNQLFLGNTAIEALRMTNNGGILATAMSGTGSPFVAVQSSLTKPVTLSGYKVWLGYNSLTATAVLSLTNCDSVFVGNKLQFHNFNNTSYRAAIYAQGGTLKALNNLIVAEYPTTGPFYGIWLSSSIAEIINNTIFVN